MKLGVSSAASSMAKEPKQFRKRERPSQESLDMRAMQEALVTVTKLSLSAKQDTRKLMAVSMTTFVVPKDSEIMAYVKTLKGFRMLLGAAPRTALERKAQEFLDSVKEEDED